MEGVVALFSIGVLLAAAGMMLLVAGYLVLAVFGVVYGVFLVLRWAYRHLCGAGVTSAAGK